eukprot:m.247323 g.247323  ORF g.247323 m.247323 type:complete len:56 (+) comp40266_c0_seq10:202-369(+)
MRNSPQASSPKLITKAVANTQQKSSSPPPILTEERERDPTPSQGGGRGTPGSLWR